MKRWPRHTRVQSFLFPRSQWTARSARSWLSKHGHKAPKTDKTDRYLRYRQAQPGRFRKATFRTITLPGTSIKAVTALPKKIPKRSNPMEGSTMEILAINPRKRRRTTKRRASAKTPKRGTPMARKRKRKTTRRTRPKARTRTRTKTVVRYRTRRAPRRRRNPSRVGRYAKSTILGVNIPGAVKNVLPLLLGALAGKVMAKKFSDTGGEKQDWGWNNYLLCLAGGLIAAVGNQAVFRGSKGTSQKIFEGALLITAYKFFTGEIAPKNATLENWFGQTDEEEARLIESAAQAIDPYSGIFGDISAEPMDFQHLGQHYVPANMLGQHYAPADMLGQSLAPATARLGAAVEPATARLGADQWTQFFDEAYR